MIYKTKQEVSKQSDASHHVQNLFGAPTIPVVVTEYNVFAHSEERNVFENIFLPLCFFTRRSRKISARFWQLARRSRKISTMFWQLARRSRKISARFWQLAKRSRKISTRFWQPARRSRKTLARFW